MPATLSGSAIGLMSGTSMDGVDGVVAAFGQGCPQILAHVHRPFPLDLRAELLALNRPGDDELHRAALAGRALALHYAAVVQALRDQPGMAGQPIRVIGAHGQTVRHRPELGYTWQINQPALLAERTGLDVVADFRSRDVAAGGQGAPLVPAFHAACWQRADEDIAVLNLGGIANLTLLPAAGPVTGFDTGPANVLLDTWIQRHLGQAHDACGHWAASGRVDTALLDRLLSEPYFSEPAPKSTGRDLFDSAWLDARLQAHAASGSQDLPAVDVQCTLSELTARTVAQAARAHLPSLARLLVCGGGAYNDHLMSRLSALLPGARVERCDAHGLAPEHVEPAAFAWLALRALDRRSGNVPAVTGAQGPRVLGALYPSSEAVPARPGA